MFDSGKLVAFFLREIVIGQIAAIDCADMKTGD